MGIKEWVTRNLRSGDLTALSAVAHGCATKDDERIRRLLQRGYVAGKNGKFVITPRGRLALLIRRLNL